ncbi:MAG: hypothetical protein JRJ54_13635 [Deltaproteobacteria bacterium]|nr:hypothetical protein [Deltaproteobacteria bacterium]
MKKRLGDLQLFAIFALIVWGVALLSSCAPKTVDKETFEGTTYKVLNSAAITYESSMSALSELNKRGMIKPETLKKARELGVKFWSSYHTATDLFASYMKVESAEKKDRIEAIIVEVLNTLSTFTAYVAPLLVE